ncbi:hypothetical protein MKZ38_000447 [Zalerion maritima]|uniref:LysM domain-containing protein n=1 Tax=Zalerion maritima TaxID=339359 RepID=A0AAD5RY86_9PEZI|nr:hypothetical protein MKZ38_000447 [Zalerion maritima]
MRMVLTDAMQDNERFAFYCPYCPDQENFPGKGGGPESSSRLQNSQTGQDGVDGEVENGGTTTPKVDESETLLSSLPCSSSTVPSSPPSIPPVEDIIDEVKNCIHHHIHPHETLFSISVLYNLSPSEVRKANSLSPTGIDDRLLLARKTVVIPGRTNSLSATPPGGEEAERRRLGIRRWMMATREPNYDIAKTYIEGSGWDVDLATDRWFGDGDWERNNGGPPRRKSDGDTNGKKKGWLGFWGI